MFQKSVILFTFSILLSSLSWAFPTPERIQAIRSTIDSIVKATLFNQIVIDHNLTLPNPAAAWKTETGYMISINHKIFDTFHVSVQNLIMFHELGHIKIGHSDMDPALKIRSEVELEADYFAAFMYKRFSQPTEELRNFIAKLSLEKTEPAGYLRAHIFYSVIFKSQ